MSELDQSAATAAAIAIHDMLVTEFGWEKPEAFDWDDVVAEVRLRVSAASFLPLAAVLLEDIVMARYVPPIPAWFDKARRWLAQYRQQTQEGVRPNDIGRTKDRATDVVYPRADASERTARGDHRTSG